MTLKTTDTTTVATETLEIREVRFSCNTISLLTRHILKLGQDLLASLFDAQGTPVHTPILRTEYRSVKCRTSRLRNSFFPSALDFETGSQRTQTSLTYLIDMY